jgi:DNA ligase-1
MQAPWIIIAELESDNSRLFKEDVIARESRAGNNELFKGFRAAYDAMITFGVKKVKESAQDGAGITESEFWAVADQLQNRTLTGNAAQAAIDALMAQATQEQWNGWYRRILIKDMRCGTSDSTINKHADPKYHVPVFTCQLAHDGANHEEKIVGDKLLEVKLDGMRVLTIVYPDGKVDQYSRNGKELLNFETVKKQIAKQSHLFTEPTVLDGEIMSANFQDLMKQARRKTDVKTDDAVLNLFDIIPLNEFLEGHGTRTQLQRSADLLTWFNLVEEHMPNVAVVGQERLDLDTPEGNARLLEINAKAIEINPATGKPRYEGIMIKDPHALYECDRTVAWLKMKPFIEVSLTAVAIEEGTGKNVGKMGAVIFEGEDDGKKIRVSVGGGWSDQDRAQIWASHTGVPVAWEKRVKGKKTVIVEEPGETVIGDVGEVRADALTKNQDSDDLWSMRFPRFKTWRGFAHGEKL